MRCFVMFVTAVCVLFLFQQPPIIYPGPRGFLIWKFATWSADRSAEPTEKKAEAFFSLLSALRGDKNKRSGSRRKICQERIPLGPGYPWSQAKKKYSCLANSGKKSCMHWPVLLKLLWISVIHFKMGKHRDFYLRFFQLVGAWRDFTVVIKLITNLRVDMVFGDAVTKLETFVWIFNHSSRSITWSLFCSP